MSAGIVQLVARGVQDQYLTSNPQVSMFQANFKRHTNFSMTSSNEIIHGVVGPGNVSVVKVPRRGDLLAHMYLTAYDVDVGGRKSVYPTTSEWLSAIDNVELLIGGQVIDKQTSEFTKTIAVDLYAQKYSQTDIATQESRFFPLRFSF